MILNLKAAINHIIYIYCSAQKTILSCRSFKTFRRSSVYKYSFSSHFGNYIILRKLKNLLFSEYLPITLDFRLVVQTGSRETFRSLFLPEAEFSVKDKTKKKKTKIFKTILKRSKTGQSLISYTADDK